MCDKHCLLNLNLLEDFKHGVVQRWVGVYRYLYEACSTKFSDNILRGLPQPSRSILKF